MALNSTGKSIVIGGVCHLGKMLETNNLYHFPRVIILCVIKQMKHTQTLPHRGGRARSNAATIEKHAVQALQLLTIELFMCLTIISFFWYFSIFTPKSLEDWIYKRRGTQLFDPLTVLEPTDPDPLFHFLRLPSGGGPGAIPGFLTQISLQSPRYV